MTNDEYKRRIAAELMTEVMQWAARLIARMEHMDENKK